MRSITPQGLLTESGVVPWSDVETVGIRTTDAGPFDVDVWAWFWLAEGRLVEVPLGPGATDALFAAFPGLDGDALVAALGSTSLRTFLLWRRSAAFRDATSARPGFAALIARLGGSAPAVAVDATFDALWSAWNAPPRRYHTSRHLAATLHHLGESPASAADRDVAALALWWHDAILDGPHPEAASAAWLREVGPQLGLPDAAVQIAARAVEATAHFTCARPPDDVARLVHDCDLEVLAADPITLLAFEDDVREEYPHVDDAGWRVGRGAALRSLRDRPDRYWSDWGRARFDARAVANLDALLASRRYAP
jgi:predicted metal-dependent HD superfamily phosphohydrolase